ncbi:MAG: LysE family translocator [Chloroflexota bacterium]
MYLIYLGIRTLLSRDEQIELTVGSGRRLTRIFSQWAMVSAINPKTALFFLAFLPQFANPAYGAATVQILFLDMLFVLLGICTNSVYALIADAARSLLQESRIFLKLQRYLAGSVYVALGITTALAGAEKSQ